MRRLLPILVLALAAFARAADEAPAATPLSREKLLAAVTRELAAHFNLDGELQVELSRPWTPPSMVATEWSIGVTEYPSVPASAMLVRCRVLADRAPVADASLLLKVSHWRDVWVTQAPLTVGATFDPSQLETRRTDLFRERDVVPASVGDRTYIFARAVPAGRLLTWHDIARRPLVRKGNVVEVSAAEGRLLITMKGLALENGAQGDTVTIRNTESQKNFAAVVVDENRVQVRF